MAKTNKKALKPFRRLNNQKAENSNTKIEVKTKNKISSGKVSKKSKRLKKKSEFVSKLSSSHEAKEKIKKAKIRSQTAVVGNMEPLFDALVDISSQKTTKSSKKVHFEKEKESKTSLVNKKKKISSERRRHQSDINDVALFQQVVSHPKFQESPLAAITDHVKYLIQKEEMDE